VSIGKFGSFPCNLLIGRPYYLTYEIADKQNETDDFHLRVVPAAELNAEILAEDALATETPTGKEKSDDSFDIVADDGSVLVKNNRLTVDDGSRQALSMEEIEALKKAGTGSGRDIIEKILQSHTHLSEKTSFALAKYTLRKHKKYLRRFTVLPMNVSMLTEYMIAEKESSRVMELREESLGLIGSWANVHYHPDNQPDLVQEGAQIGGGRWLVVDDTGGLVVASLAEKMGVLYHPDHEDDDSDSEPSAQKSVNKEKETATETTIQQNEDSEMQDVFANSKESEEVRTNGKKRPRNKHNTDLASTNTLTVLHANAQPNVSLLKYFAYDTNNPSASHPLHRHLKTLSWLQLIDPSADPTYHEPESVPQDELDTWKSGKRGAYYRKRRRWARCKSIVDETRAGGFDGLVIASSMDPTTILKQTVHLLRGSAQIVIYTPTVEPLAEIMDLYSKDRKAAFLEHIANDMTGLEEDFPLDPRLILAPTLQTTRIRPWQVLPGRTHPLMTWRGGAEGYIFTARRVLPGEGKVEARGKYNKNKKRKTG
jgi:tRNA (adenine-N(1)-)-methyltransferase non-catalytic subunit